MLTKYRARHTIDKYITYLLGVQTRFAVAEQLTKLLEELGKDKQSFEDLHISFEEKAFFDILEALAKKYNFYDEYIKKHGEEHLINLAKEIKVIVDDKAKYACWSVREDIKADLKVDIILKLAE